MAPVIRSDDVLSGVTCITFSSTDVWMQDWSVMVCPYRQESVAVQSVVHQCNSTCESQDLQYSQASLSYAILTFICTFLIVVELSVLWLLFSLSWIECLVCARFFLLLLLLFSYSYRACFCRGGCWPASVLTDFIMLKKWAQVTSEGLRNLSCVNVILNSISWLIQCF